MIQNKKILYAGNSPWGDPSEQHIMVELLSGSNDVIWANPFGPVTGALLPRVTTSKEGLTIYNPGLNLLPISALSGFNEKRRLMQVNLYLVERDFLPELVWIDDPAAAPFTLYYGKKGALTLYYAGKEETGSLSSSEREKLAGAVDLLLVPDPQLFRKYESTGKAYLLEGGDLLPVNETGDEDAAADEMLEQFFLEAVTDRLEEISALVKKELAVRA